MEKKSVKHYTVDELLQLFADAYGQKKVTRESDEQLFNESKRENYA